MRLKKLEIYGFKSFAERVEMTFDQGITGIVGPNGSGKSNISDAVRWVLGEQSAKSLRGAKMEDIIFNGTEKRKQLAYCEVSLVFDNDDQTLPISFAEVMVTRRVYRNGDSEYYLNKAACRLKDIVDLFRDTGIGKEGYSLIGQGRIDEILSVKSEDRRQVFEEAAGIVKYKARKHEAERRMENTQMNLGRVMDIIAELERRLEPLRKQSESARKYLALRDELKGLDLNVFLVRNDRLKERINTLTETVTGLGEAIEQANASQETLLNERKQLEDQLQSLETEAGIARGEMLTMTQETEAQEGFIGVLKERIVGLKKECKRLEDEINRESDSQMAIGAKLVTANAKLTEDKQKLASQRSVLYVESGNLASEEAELTELEAQINSQKEAIIGNMNRLTDVKTAQTRLNTMKSAILKQIELIQENLQKLEDDSIRLNDTLAAAISTKAQGEEIRKDLAAKLSGVEASIRENAAAIENTNQKSQNVINQRHGTASRLKVLEEMARDYEGYQQAVKQVLLAARKTGGSGVHGVVAEVITAPKELERALDMVLGGALQNVIVENEHDAKRMIDYLRQNKFGRATFLPISAVKGRTLTHEERSVLGMPGCIGVASELISFDPKYQEIINSLLGRTIIAKDLECGIAIQRKGKQAFRLVTLEGDVMHSGGSMTGGSTQSRVTNLLSREREISEHKGRITQLDQETADLKAAMNQLELQRNQLKSERAELFDTVRQEEIAAARDEERIARAETELEACKNRIRSLMTEQDKMQDSLQDIEAELGGMDTEQGHEESYNAQIKHEIAVKQQDLLKRRQALSIASEQVTKKRLSVAALEQGIASHDREILRLQGDLVGVNDALEKSGVAHDSAVAELWQDEELMHTNQIKLSSLQSTLHELKNKFQCVDAKRTGVQEKLRSISGQLDALRIDLDSFVEKHHRADVQLAKVENELKQLSDRIWEEYELTYAGAQEYYRENFQFSEAEKRIEKIRSEIRSLGTVNVNAVEDYRLTLERFEELSRQRDDLLKAQEHLHNIIEELLTKMEVQFKKQFLLLNENFKETFAALFNGGHAELRLTDMNDVLNCNIEIVAQPPGKRLQLLTLLSGGERALTAIAILFAMLKLKPTPFCMLDEIEAALDDANIGNFADYLANYSKNTQFVVVTHRKGTMERCDALYGVAMEEKGISRMMSVQLSDREIV